MKVKLLSENLKVFAKAVQCLSKVGEDLYIEGKQDRLELRSVNQSRSAFACVVFAREFFASFTPLDRSHPGRLNASSAAAAASGSSLTASTDLGNDSSDSSQANQNSRSADEPDIRCKVLNKSCLGAFKSMNALSKSVESCTITLDVDREEIVFKLQCFYGINKTYQLQMEDCDPLQVGWCCVSVCACLFLSVRVCTCLYVCVCLYRCAFFFLLFFQDALLC